MDNVGLTDSLFGLVLSQTQFMDLKFVIFEGFGLVCSTYVDLGHLFPSWQNMRSKVLTFWRGSQFQISVSFDDLSESKDRTVKFEAVQILLYIWEFDPTLIWPRPLEQPG